MDIMASLAFAASIIGFVECELRLFPKANHMWGAVFYVLAAVVCIGVAFSAVNLMNSQDDSTLGWSIAVSLLTLYSLIRGIITYRGVRRGDERSHEKH